MLKYSEAFQAVGSAKKMFAMFTGGQRGRLSKLATASFKEWAKDDVDFFEEIVGSLADDCEMKFIPATR